MSERSVLVVGVDVAKLHLDVAALGDGQSGVDLLERFVGPPAGAVAHHAHFGPAAGDVDRAERVADSPRASPPSWPTRSISRKPE